MKYFLIVFDRRAGSIVRFTEYAQADDALTARFEAEDNFAADDGIEVVVLGAQSEDALHRTHGRYFQGPFEMAGDALSKLSSAARMAI